MKIAFLGLGAMGTPMAGRLLDAGNDVVVWNRTPKKAEALGERGARIASTPADAARGADATITMLADEEALEQVVLGADGVREGIATGTALIDMSTVGPAAIARIGEALPDVDVIDAPVLGSITPAARGELIVLMGASDAAAERWRGLLETFGRVVNVGGPGSAAAMKLIVNSTFLAAISALGEALALGAAFGLPRATVLDVLEMGLFAPMVRYKRALIEADSYEDAAFSLVLAAKDARLVDEAATEEGLQLAVARAVRAWLDDAGRTRGAEDVAAVVAHIQERSKRT
ncbi:MAG: NAD(P)-dependent oxidoreductase [Actinomycetota bacterium]